MKKALITGIAGFAGSHLAEDLVHHGWRVTGIDRPGAPTKNLEGVLGDLTLEECDILQSEQVNAVLERSKPDLVFHLAAISFVPSAEGAPRIAFEANVRGSLTLLEECRKQIPGARVVMISSAEVYGKVTPDDVPLREDREPRPANIYALTKLCAEEISHYYGRSSSPITVVLRPFNHIGPRQNPNFVTSSFARQIAEIEAGRKPPVIEVGNLEAARDFTDVRDTVRGYRLAAELCEPGKPYNICSGRAYVIKDILEKLLKISSAEIEVRVDRARLRKSEVPLLCGDHSRFSNATGWEPEYDIDATLDSILNYWRDEI